MTELTEFVDLASERLGGSALATNDEFFAPKERLLKDVRPLFIEDRYTDRGKWMDGWETRRRRETGHDWCIIRLGLPGTIHGVIVDTSHFTGNYPEACSIDAAIVSGYPGPDELASVAWREILPRSILAGDARNQFPVHATERFTHLRLNIFPDGGVARLRVYGRARPDWGRLCGREIDLAAVEHGGLVLAASDMFYGRRHNLIMPGPPLGMADGWETKRRRGPGHDWAIVELGRPGRVNRAEVDTTHFKGNAPGRCSLDACDAAELDVADIVKPDRVWQVLLPETNLQPNTRHVFEELRSLQRVSHVRFNIFPDGGVGRLRLYGTVSGRD